MTVWNPMAQQYVPKQQAIAEFLERRISDTLAECRYAQAEARTAGHGETSLAFVVPQMLVRECEAKRQIIALHPCDNCGAGDDPCATLRWLARPYVQHADYRDEWMP